MVAYTVSENGEAMIPLMVVQNPGSSAAEAPVLAAVAPPAMPPSYGLYIAYQIRLSAAPSLAMFRRRLKTYFYNKAYPP